MATRTARTNGRATIQTAEDLNTEPLLGEEDASIGGESDGDSEGTEKPNSGESINALGDDDGNVNGGKESDERLNADENATALFFPMASMSEGETTDELADATARPAFPAFADTVEAMHHCNGLLAKLLLALPVHKMSRALTAALGEEGAVQWRQRFEQAQQQRARIAEQIVEQAMQSSLGIR